MLTFRKVEITQVFHCVRGRITVIVPSVPVLAEAMSMLNSQIKSLKNELGYFSFQQRQVWIFTGSLEQNVESATKGEDIS